MSLKCSFLENLLLNRRILIEQMWILYFFPIGFSSFIVLLLRGRNGNRRGETPVVLVIIFIDKTVKTFFWLLNGII